MRHWLTGLALLASGAAMAADEPAKPGDLTLARVFASPDLGGAQPQSLKLSPDGTLLTSRRARANDRERFDLWATDTRTGQERMLVDSLKLGSGAELSEAEKMQRERARVGGQKGVIGYDWSPDGRSLLVPIDGDLYLAGTDGKARKLAGTRDALNPVVSPRGGFVSFVRQQNLYAMPLGGGEARRLTTDGAGTVHWGEAEFVAQEEMDRRTGYWWSPDERFVAVERFDEAPVHVATRAAIGAAGTKTYEQRYPAAGTPNVLVDLYVMRPGGGEPVKVDLGTDRDIYLARVDWSADGNTLYVQRQNRLQTRLDLLAVDPATGTSRIVFTENAKPKSWINLHSSFRALRDGSLIWWSERDGWGHLYRWQAGKWTQLTKGDWAVTGLVGVDQSRGRLFFTGTKDGVLERHVYAVDMAKPGVVTRLTEPGWFNSATMDGAASRMIVTRSNENQPAQVYLADADGKRLSWINENKVAGQHPYAPFLASHEPTKFGTLTTKDGATLHWEMITPKLEPGRRYPVFFQHYGGPHSQTVAKQWGGALQQYLVDRGWIFFQLDNRGSPNRGKPFEDAIWHAMGSIEVTDQQAGADYLKTLPFVDGSKIATYGWSYGGYMSLKMLEDTPGTYAAAIAGAPVTDWALYDTHYTERYMGDPKKDAAAYAASAAVEKAGGIRDPLLLIHGMADDNVFLDNSTKVAAKMQASGTRFEMMLYPGYTHRVGGPVSVHLWTTILDFLDRHVKDRPPAE